MATETQQHEPTSQAVKTLIEKLRKGQEWLTREHEYWLQEYTVAVDSETFSEQLAAWDEHEQILRKGGYKGCIWQPLNRCSTKSPVKCFGCISDQPELW